MPLTTFPFELFWSVMRYSLFGDIVILAWFRETLGFSMTTSLSGPRPILIIGFSMMKRLSSSPRSLRMSRAMGHLLSPPGSVVHDHFDALGGQFHRVTR